MGFKLLEVKNDDEFPPLWKAFRESFMDPGTALWPAFMGDWRPYDPPAIEAAMKESSERWCGWHRADPTSVWLKVVDEATEDIVAGGRWSIHKKGQGNPYDSHGAMEAYWFPEGDIRTVASKFVNDFLATANKNSNFPHAFLNVLFTVPKYRGKGAASMIMDWGFAQARENGLDVYIEATKEGKPLYEKYGLRPIAETSAALGDEHFPPTNDPAVREALVKELTPFTWWSMYGSPK